MASQRQRRWKNDWLFRCVLARKVNSSGKENTASNNFNWNSVDLVVQRKIAFAAHTREHIIISYISFCATPYLWFDVRCFSFRDANEFIASLEFHVCAAWRFCFCLLSADEKAVCDRYCSCIFMSNSYSAVSVVVHFSIERDADHRKLHKHNYDFHFTWKFIASQRSGRPRKCFSRRPDDLEFRYEIRSTQKFFVCRDCECEKNSL